MGSTKKVDKSLSFRNFSPFYERALAESKRGDNVLKLIERDIDKRKMVAYSQLSAEQRMVEKDLYALKMAQKRIFEDKKKRNRRALSESGLDDIDRRRLERSFTIAEEPLHELSSWSRARTSSSTLPPLQPKGNTVTSKRIVQQTTGSSQVFASRWDNRSSLTKNNKYLARRSVSAPTFVTDPRMSHAAGSSSSFTDSNTVFDGQF